VAPRGGIEAGAPDTLAGEIPRFVWATRYRDPDAKPAESGIADTWRRVAAAAASVESDSAGWSERFLEMLHGFRFLPAGRILAGAGTRRRVTLFNCFVMGTIEDSIEGIFEALKEGALTMQQGGGVGYDFSTLRPRGSRACGTGMTASGPVSFMHVWDTACATILATGARRGAMMATLRCDHPDIEEFIDAKRAPDALRHFNLSVLVTDPFMQAVRDDAGWPLVFAGDEHRTLPARGLWERLSRAAYDSAEPGVLFIDRINAANNLAYCERLCATNPCGEEPLPPYGACNLGSINLTAFVREPFTPKARFDLDGIAQTARCAVRFLDNVIDISGFPLDRQRDQVRRSRRIGLGITGLADALAMLTLRYDGEPARQAAAGVMETVCHAAYAASSELAREKGAFPQFRADAYLDRPFIRALPEDIRGAIRRAGMRNSHLTAIAPTGTISLLAGNVSSGIEPCFGFVAERRVLGPDGSQRTFPTPNYAYARWRSGHGESEPLPPYFAEGPAIAAEGHLRMQAALQPHVDSGISKTIPLPWDFPVAAVPGLFRSAYDLGLKGCTLFRAGARVPVVASRCAATPGDAPVKA
jgi:ribonucleoside-diphosphate reductase alpha chain